MQARGGFQFGAADILTALCCLLLLGSIVIGPLLVGSYFGHWRWPLIYCCSSAALLLIFKNFFGSADHSTRLSWALIIPIILIIIQGCWMWFNTWGEFSRHSENISGAAPWSVRSLENQPFPSLSGSPDKAEAWDRLSYIFPCLALIFGVRSLIISKPSWSRLIAVTVFWTGVTVALVGLTQRWTDAKGVYWLTEYASIERKLFFGPYRSPGIAASLLNIALALGLSIFLTPTNKNPESKMAWLSVMRTILYLLGIIILTTAAVSTGSKTGTLLALLTLAAWLWCNRRAVILAYRRSAAYFPGNERLERNLVTVTILCIALIAILSFAGTMVLRWQEAAEGDFASLAGRGATNAVQIEMMQDEEWGALGYGPGSFYPLFPYFVGDHDVVGIYVYAHNDYLQTLVEWGWLGTSAFAVILGGGVFMLTREVVAHKQEHSKNRVILMRGYLIAIVICMLHALIDFPFQIESIAVIFSALLGVAWASSDLRGREIETIRRS
ncbi:polymerase [Oceaniferula spumae]|uniref:Polymerase n=2 Tax=Oceaniferula spumae TaxID=2979115 RepID=A0AAT9FNQ7_9BACT